MSPRCYPARFAVGALIPHAADAGGTDHYMRIGVR